MIATGFLKLNRRTTVDVYSNAAGEYTRAYLRLDTERTFDPSKTKWKFWGPQGQADVEGVFLSPPYTELSYNDADPAASSNARSASPRPASHNWSTSPPQASPLGPIQPMTSDARGRAASYHRCR